MKYLYNIPDNLADLLNAPEFDKPANFRPPNPCVQTRKNYLFNGDMREKLSKIFSQLACYQDKTKKLDAQDLENAVKMFSFFLDNCDLLKSDCSLNMLIYTTQLEYGLQEYKFFALFLLWSMKTFKLSVCSRTRDFLNLLACRIPLKYASEFSENLDSLFMRPKPCSYLKNTMQTNK